MIFLHCIFFADRIYKDFPNERALDFPDYNTRFLYSLRPMVTYLYLHVLHCICICTVLYLYLLQPMMIERGLWNFVYPHLSKSGHCIAMH